MAESGLQADPKCLPKIESGYILQPGKRYCLFANRKLTVCPGVVYLWIARFSWSLTWSPREPANLRKYEI